jgi:hypothetical protein
MTLLLFVYRKFFPFGSPPNTIGVPRVVLGKEAKTLSEIKIKLMTKKTHYKTIHTTVKPCFIPPDSSPNSHKYVLIVLALQQFQPFFNYFILFRFGVEGNLRNHVSSVSTRYFLC